MNQTRARACLPLAIPLVLAILVFARATSFPFVNWDDPSHFVQNPLAEHPLARGFGGLFWTEEIGYPAPILLLSFALDRTFWGLQAGPYHAENVILHLTNVSMLFVLARRMRLTAREACAVATIFAVHPLVVEPVCWVTGRKDVLATAMVLGATLLASGSPLRNELSSARRWIGANLLAMLAVLVLPRALVASVLIALLVHAVRPAWGLRRIALRISPAFPFALSITALGARKITELGAVPARTWTEAALDIGGAWALQASHVVCPLDLNAYYFRIPGDPPLWAMIAAVVAALVALGFVAVSTRRGSPVRAGTMLALVAYAPVSCVFRIHRWTADSYMYFPLAAMSLAIVPMVSRVWPVRLARFGVYASLALAAVVAFLSFAYTGRWSSSANVWAGSIARYPSVPLAFEHEALGLLATGRTREANAVFVQIAERFPSWDDTFDDEVRAYEAAGDPRRAREVLVRGVRSGSVPCIRMYWMRLLTTSGPPETSERELVALAFPKGFEIMKGELHDPRGFRRVVAILRALGLDDLATQAATYLAQLERDPPRRESQPRPGSSAHSTGSVD